MKLTKVLYVPQSAKQLLSTPRFVSKGAMMGASQDKITIKENGASMVLDARKGQNKIMMFYLKANRYHPEGQAPLANLPKQEKDSSDKK